ncbi:MAG: nucleotidyltransferase domain-containing protein [Prevotellaceae bacterium]|jgi:predicted nucleotidyltransferase|nr:nucleotidyltransferase domain-containing protein [Prevotellaceae bacterium]
MTSYDEILDNIKRAVEQNASDAKIILFGSRARGDARPDSDWDVLILLDRDEITPADYDTIVFPLFDMAWKLDTYVSPKLYTKNEWKKRSGSLFYKNVEAEGIAIN